MASCVELIAGEDCLWHRYRSDSFFYFDCKEYTESTYRPVWPPHMNNLWIESSSYRLAGLWLFVSIRFQIYFTPLPGVFFTFPSRNLSTIGHKKYLALPDGSGRFPQGFSCPVVLKKLLRRYISFAYTAFMFYGLSFQICSARYTLCNSSIGLLPNHTILTTPLMHKQQSTRSPLHSSQRES